MDFIANQEPQIKEMLQVIGIKEVEELFSAIPKEILLAPIKEDDGISEFEGIEHMKALASKNLAFKRDNYLGAGAYEHHIPAIASAICQKSEFLTSYTPYQAEASQGMLQIIFEFQSVICALTGMDAANASLYDGASACAEAVLMSLRIQKNKKKILIAETLNPHYQKVIEQYIENLDVECVYVPMDSQGVLSTSFLKEHLENAAAFILQSPNFLGIIENVDEIFKFTKEAGVINILASNPISYGLYKTGGEVGADICIGDCQPLGIPLQFGGPYAGYISCKNEFIRQMPGRIVGETKDLHGKRGFVLTLQAREQHIRREKATSNICTNQALCALSTLITILWYGPVGLKSLALTNFQRAMYLKNELQKIPGVTLYAKDKPIFNEFVILLEKDPSTIISYFHENNIDPGIKLTHYYDKLSNGLLVCVTETKSKEQLDKYVKIMNQAITKVGA